MRALRDIPGSGLVRRFRVGSWHLYVPCEDYECQVVACHLAFIVFAVYRREDFGSPIEPFLMALSWNAARENTQEEDQPV